MKKHLLQAAGILVLLTGLTSTQALQREQGNLRLKGRTVAITHDNGIMFQTPGLTALIGQAIATNKTASTQKSRRSIKAYNPAAAPLLPGGGVSAPD